jgi:hypothetical protein
MVVMAKTRQQSLPTEGRTHPGNERAVQPGILVVGPVRVIPPMPVNRSLLI